MGGWNKIGRGWVGKLIKNNREVGGLFGTRQYRCEQSKTGDSGRTNDNRNNLAKFNSSF